MVELSSSANNLITETKKLCISKSHTVVSIEHFGIILLRDQKILEILNELNADIDGIKTDLLNLVQKGEFNDSKSFEISDKLKSVISDSYLEAKKLETKTIEGEFIFLSLLRNVSKVKNIFNDFGIFYDEVLSVVINKSNMFTNDNDENTLFGSSGSNKKSKDFKSKTPILDNFSRDLSKLADEGKIDPIIGRDKEILRVSQILSRRTKRNPLLIGEPGCVLGDTMIRVKKISDLSIHTIIKK